MKVRTEMNKPLGPAEAIRPRCEWWLLCTNFATTTRSHPVLGEVPICKRCDEKVEKLS